MSKKSESPSLARTEWLDEKSDTPLIGQYVERLGTFMDAMADGKIDDAELKAQQARVVAQLKAVEPELSDALHEKVTHLLCELSAYNIMHTLHHLVASQPRTKFRG
jgi:alpha-D-ribose 1-methylphosphonate 5-triphosphate diphosphatase PhnM